MKKFLTVVVLSLFPFTSVLAEQPVSKKFSTEFNKMKSLAGDWQGNMEKGGKTMQINVNYKVSSAGSSIIETSFPGTPREMVSVYTEIDGNINMTHYCALQNQPTLSLQGATKDTLEFDYIKGSNLDVKKDAHMHHLTLKFKSKNKIVQQWTQYKDGKSVGISAIELSRVN